MISYPSKWKTKEEIYQHYRKSYRNPPSHLNVFTGERKLHFHEAFLKDVFADWKTKDFKEPKILEIGAAYGMVLSWIKNKFPEAHLFGTELTTSFRRVAHHELGIKLDEEFDDTKKYDLIISYKVAEHQLDVDKELRKYAECLSDNGLLYISVPTWFKSMYNFGLGGFDLEYYYDPNHINVWTVKLFETLLKKCGLEIIKSDQIIYDSTYLCKRNDELMKEAPQYESVDEIKLILKKIKDSFFAFNEHKFDEAIAIFPDYPTAHISKAEMIRKQALENGWPWIKENVIESSLKACPNSTDIYVMASDFAMRANQWEDAIKYSELGLKGKPENPVCLNQLIIIMREMALASKKDGNEKARLHYFNQALNIARHLRTVSSQHRNEATDFIYLYSAQIPMPGESA